MFVGCNLTVNIALSFDIIIISTSMLLIDTTVHEEEQRTLDIINYSNY